MSTYLPVCNERGWTDASSYASNANTFQYRVRKWIQFVQLHKWKFVLGGLGILIPLIVVISHLKSILLFLDGLAQSTRASPVWGALLIMGYAFFS
jgi:hypothetical protein